MSPQVSRKYTFYVDQYLTLMAQIFTVTDENMFSRREDFFGKELLGTAAPTAKRCLVLGDGRYRNCGNIQQG